MQINWLSTFFSRHYQRLSFIRQQNWQTGVELFACPMANFCGKSKLWIQSSSAMFNLIVPSKRYCIFFISGFLHFTRHFVGSLFFLVDQIMTNEWFPWQTDMCCSWNNIDSLRKQTSIFWIVTLSQFFVTVFLHLIRINNTISLFSFFLYLLIHRWFCKESAYCDTWQLYWNSQIYKCTLATNNKTDLLQDWISCLKIFYQLTVEY